MQSVLRDENTYRLQSLPRPKSRSSLPTPPLGSTICPNLTNPRPQSSPVSVSSAAPLFSVGGPGDVSPYMSRPQSLSATLPVLSSQASLSSDSATPWSPRARLGSGYRSPQYTVRRTLTAVWRPSWRWGGCVELCPKRWVGTSRARVPLLPQGHRDLLVSPD